MGSLRQATIGGAVLALCFGAKSAMAGPCDPGKAGYDLTTEEVAAVYDCIKDRLHEGYVTGEKSWIPAEYIAEYRNWKMAATAPAAPGFHGERYLVTYVNDIGHDAYVQYAEDPSIPPGTLIAKESFSISEEGKAVSGPLFLMEKVAEGISPETGDWYYSMVSAKGAPQAVNVVSACSECHQENFGHQGGLGYPVEDVRLK